MLACFCRAAHGRSTRCSACSMQPGLPASSCRSACSSWPVCWQPASSASVHQEAAHRLHGTNPSRAMCMHGTAARR
jgi:hypothetical protein